jgi:hypothetical protein
VVVDAEVNETNKTTLWSERRSALRKSLTGPTLSEMFGNPSHRDLPFVWLRHLGRCRPRLPFLFELRADSRSDPDEFSA